MIKNYYPEMPPMQENESPEQYTDRLTGADKMNCIRYFIGTKEVYLMDRLNLSLHPNYKSLAEPQWFDTPISYALKCAAHLVSPPQFEGESSELECIKVAEEIRDLKDLVEYRWREHLRRH